MGSRRSLAPQPGSGPPADGSSRSAHSSVSKIALRWRAVAMAAMGYHAGATQPARSPVIFLLALGFSSVILVVADLDRPLEGWLRVSQQALIDTRESMDH